MLKSIESKNSFVTKTIKWGTKSNSKTPNTISQLLNEFPNNGLVFDNSIVLESPLQKSTRIINEYLEECNKTGWDGYDALPVNSFSAEFSKQFLRSLPRKYQQPDIAPQGDGEIGMEWRKKDDSIIVSIDEQRNLTWGGRCKGEAVYGASKFKGYVPVTLKIQLVKNL